RARKRRNPGLQRTGRNESRPVVEDEDGSGDADDPEGRDGGRGRGLRAVRDADGRRGEAAPQVHLGECKVRAEPGRVSSSIPCWLTRCEIRGSAGSVSLSPTTIARSSASKPSFIPSGSRANTDAIGSPASTLSPGFTVITNPTVGSTSSSTLMRSEEHTSELQSR